MDLQQYVIHSGTKKCPSIVLTRKSIPLQRMHSFEAAVKVHAHIPSERALTARTTGDSRLETDHDAATTVIIDSAEQSSFTGRFLGWSNHPNVILVLKEGEGEEPSRVIRAHTMQLLLATKTMDTMYISARDEGHSIRLVRD